MYPFNSLAFPASVLDSPLLSSLCRRSIMGGVASRLQGGEGARRLEESGEEEVKAIIYDSYCMYYETHVTSNTVTLLLFSVGKSPGQRNQKKKGGGR